MSHVPFNASLLKTICLAFPGEPIHFYADKSHLKYVREEFGEDSSDHVSWNELSIPGLKAGFYARLAPDFRMVSSFLDMMTTDDVFVMTANPSVLWALKYYTAKPSHKGKKVQVILHGDFSTLYRIPRRSMLNPFYYVGSLKRALKMPGYERLQHIVLEEPIKDEVLKHLPFLHRNIEVLDHPIPLNSDSISMENLDLPIHFAFLGRAIKQKGFTTYLKVGAEVTKRFPGKVQFHYIGRVRGRLLSKYAKQMSFLYQMPGTERVERSEYTSRLKAVHFICLFYENKYKSCASGVLMDSIAWGKPIVGTKVPLFEKLQHTFGDTGYLSDKEDLIEVISSIVGNRDNQRYERQISNMMTLKSSRTPEALAVKYQDIVNNL